MTHTAKTPAEMTATTMATMESAAEMTAMKGSSTMPTAGIASVEVAVMIVIEIAPKSKVVVPEWPVIIISVGWPVIVVSIRWSVVVTVVWHGHAAGK
jgi:hypothetical protein